MTDKTIAVLGAGNVGHAMSGHLALKGYRVHLYNRWEKELEAIREAGGIYMQQEVDDFATPALVTTDMAEAVEGADIIAITVPAFGHKFMSEELVKHVSPGQLVVFQPGVFGDTLEFQALAKAAGVEGVLVAESETSLYSCRVVGDARVNIRAIKSQVRIAALPAADTSAVIELLDEPFGGAYQPAANVLDIGMSNGNPVYHCAPSLLNIGRVTGGEDWPFYEFFQPETARVVASVDQERIDIAASYGIEVPSFWDFLQSAYGVTDEDPVQRVHKAYGRGNASRAPKSLDDRYLTEDIPFGLVPWASLGKLAGVPTPTIDSLVHVASLIYAKDFAEEGRTVEDLGLEGMSAAQVFEYVNG